MDQYINMQNNSFPGVCPSFSIPINLTNPKKIEIFLKDALFYKIFMYQRGWFYTLFEGTAMVYNYVGKGKNVDLFMSLQVIQSLPIEGIYKYTVPDNTSDCDDNLDHDFDTEVTNVMHDKINKTYGCTIPVWGGFKDKKLYEMCTNTSLYSMEILQPYFKGYMLINYYCKSKPKPFGSDLIFHV